MLAVLLLSAAKPELFAQPDSTTTLLRLQAGHYWLLPHSSKIAQFKGLQPQELSFSIGRSNHSAAAWEKLGAFSQYGFRFSHADFNDSRLGSSSSLSLYAEVLIQPQRKLHFSVHGEAGLSYLSQRYDSLLNPENLFFGSRFAFLLTAGINAHYRLHPQYQLLFSGYYAHISNGGLQQPNLGMNYPGLLLGVQHALKPLHYPHIRQPYTQPKPWQLAMRLFATAPSADSERSSNSRSFLLGIDVATEKRLGRLNGFLLGAEADYNSGRRQWLETGIKAGHMFYFGDFYFSQQMGAYVFRQGKQRLFQRYELLYFISKSIGLGVGLKAHAEVAQNIDLRLIWRK